MTVALETRCQASINAFADAQHIMEVVQYNDIGSNNRRDTMIENMARVLAQVGMNCAYFNLPGDQVMGRFREIFKQAMADEAAAIHAERNTIL